MADDSEFVKLPLEERCTHKLWKARLHGYTEAAKLFEEEDEKAPIFSQFIGLVSKLVGDSNAAAQEKGLEATLLFVKNAAVAGKTVKDVMSVIVAKCIAAPKAKTKDLAVQIALMYIEIEKHEQVVEELVKGMEHKNPKIVAACISALTLSLKEFGSKVVSIKPMIKMIGALLEDRDKTVREECKAMVVEIFRWIREAIKPQLTSLKPIQISELEVEFDKVRGEKAVPARYLRSQQVQQQAAAAAAAASATDENGDSGAGGDEDVEAEAIDPYDLMDPINILSKIPGDFYEKLEAKKWQERKEAIESLEKLLEYPKFEKGDYGDLVRALVKIITKDSNVVVVGLAVKCIGRLALGLKKGFQPYANSVLPQLLEKFKEKKANVVGPLRDAVDAIYPITTLDAISEDVASMLDNKNPAVKSETAAFLSRCFCKCTPTILSKKLLKLFVTALLKTLNEPDPTVRDNAAEALGTAMKVVGERAMTPLMPDLDNLKLSKIKECCDKAVVVKAPAAPVRPAAVSGTSAAKPERSKSETAAVKGPTKTSSGPKKVSSVSAIKKTGAPKVLEVEPPEEGSKSSEKGAASTKGLEGDGFDDSNRTGGDVPRTDIGPKITEQLINNLGDKNWKVRNEALITLSNIINDAKQIKSNLGELPTVLCQRLVDSNGKLAVLALEICTKIATAMGSQCKIHVRTFFRGFLTALSDSKQWVRAAALTCINTWAAEGGHKEFFDGEIIPDALKTGSPTLRIELWTWLADVLPNAKSLPKEEICLCVPYLFTSLEDRNSDVRKSAQNAVLGVMMHVGYQNMVKQTEKLKPGSKTQIMAALDKVRTDIPIPETTKTTKSKTSVAAKAKKKEEEIDLTPLLPINNMKNQRLVDEQKLKTLRWNFTMPRSEFVDLLREQMTIAGFNKTLIANMFHADFKYHLKAIESLSEDLVNVDAVVSNLDLILKWMTLRFFDTNPSVLLKGLEYLTNVFSMLIENEYTIFDFEANSFIPYLVLKIGDPKDAVREKVRAILKQLSLMYPAGKLFTLIMDGLKSKNARQRTECLEELGNLIEEFGMSVCQPTPSAALKEISKQISDRDNSVRSSALNAIVKAYFIEGDKVYKLIGKISEKDLSLLEERVKRASKVRSNQTIATKYEMKEKEKSPETKMISHNMTNIHHQQQEEEEEMYEPPPPPVSVQKARPSNFAQNLFKELDLVDPPIQKIELIEIDDSFLNSPVQIPERIAARASKSNVVVAPPKDELLIEQVIREVGSPNISVAFQSASKLRLVLESHDRSVLNVYTDSIMDSLVTQLKFVNSYSLEKCGLILPQTYRMLFRIIDDIFGKKTSMGLAVKVHHLQVLLQELLLTLVEDKTAKFAEGGYNKWINVFVARIIEDSDHTNVTCAVIKLLYDVVGNPPQNPKVTDLTTKCLLKIIVLIKQGSSTWCEVLELEDVLYECHLFFQAYPRHTWKDRPSIVPLKAIKTLLLALVGLKGKDIFSYLSRRIENPCASELSMYLKRLLKTQPAMAKAATNTRLSKVMSDHLSEIFMKIAYEETAKEGLVQLYEFKKQNPQLDLSSFLAPTSKYFQDYVEHGLRKIEMERGPLKPSPKKQPEATPVPPAVAGLIFNQETAPPQPTAGESGTDLAQYYLDKLREFQTRMGFPLTNLPDFKNES